MVLRSIHSIVALVLMATVAHAQQLAWWGQSIETTNSFVTTWELAGADTVKLPFRNYSVFDCTVEWGDGSANSTITTWDDADKTHSYASGGTYQVVINGTMGNFYFNNGGDVLLLKTVEQWGDVNIHATGFSHAFFGCANLTSVPYEFPWTHLTSIVYAFYGCTSWTGPMPDISGCTNLSNARFICYNCANLEGAVVDLGVFPSLTDARSAYGYNYKITSGLTTVIPPSCTTFQGTYAGNHLLVGDVSAITNSVSCTYFEAQDANVLTYESTGGMLSTNVPNGYIFNMSGCNLIADHVNNILVDLDTSGATNGTCTLAGDNAAPTGAGVTAFSSLTNKTWTVTVN